MAGWSDLPLDILLSIPERIPDDIDILRFRSVCSSWRSSCLPRTAPALFSTEFPAATTEDAIYTFCVHRRSLLLVKSLHGNNPWLLKVESGFDGRMRPHCPLSAYRILHGSFRNKVLDLSKFRVVELGHEYISVRTIYRDHHSLTRTQVTEHFDRLALIQVGSDHFVFLARYFNGDLTCFRSGDTDWMVFGNTGQTADLASFNGRFYAVNKQGGTLVFDQSANVSCFDHLIRSDLSAETISRFLVESGGEMLLVDIGFHTSSSPGRFQFRMYKLNEESSKWDEVELKTSLGDRVLFLGEVGSFSASASQLGWPRGNFIYFGTGSSNLRNLDAVELYGDDNLLASSMRSIYVYDLDKSEITSLEKCYPELNLFSPPHQWFLASRTPAGMVSSKSPKRNVSGYLSTVTRRFKSMFT